MNIETQSETKDGTRIRITLSTLNLDTHSRIQDLDPSARLMLEKALKDCATWVSTFISAHTVKKTA